MIKHKFQSLADFGHFDHHRDELWICPECKQSVGSHGINKLAYTMDACTCRVIADYDHVVEQIWHKACLVTYLTKHPEQQKDYRYLESVNKASSGLLVGSGEKPAKVTRSKRTAPAVSR